MDTKPKNTKQLQREGSFLCNYLSFTSFSLLNSYRPIIDLWFVHLSRLCENEILATHKDTKMKLIKNTWIIDKVCPCHHHCQVTEKKRFFVGNETFMTLYRQNLLCNAKILQVNLERLLMEIDMGEQKLSNTTLNIS